MIRVAATLVGQLYRSVCAPCLADELGTSVHDADDVARVLANKHFVREWQRCGRCHEDDIVLSHVPTYPLIEQATV